MAYVSYYPQQNVTFDAAEYDRIATVLLTSGEYQSFERSPLYPTFLAVVYKMFGHNYLVVRQAQAVLVGFTTIVGYFVAREVLDRKRAFLASLLMSFYPGFIAYSGLLLVETLFTFLLTVMMLFLVKTFKSERLKWPALCGLMLGIAALCRSEILAFPVFILVGLIWLCPNMRQAMWKICVIVAAMVLTVSPWSIRNSSGLGGGVSGGLGATLWLSSYPEDWLEWKADREPLRSLLSSAYSPRELDRKLLQEGLKNIATYPLAYAQMSVKRFFRFWAGSHSNTIRGLEQSFGASLSSDGGFVFPMKVFLLLVNIGLVLLALWGILGARVGWSAALPLVLLILYINIVHTFLFSTSRYQIPIMPMVLILSAAGIGGCRSYS